MAGAFSRKASGITCDLTAFRKIKEHRANAVETPLVVTGLLHCTCVTYVDNYLELFDNLSLGVGNT